MKSLEPHFCLQILVNPEAGKDNHTVHFPQLDFTAVTYDPRLGYIKTWNSRSRYGPMLLCPVHNCLPSQPLLLLSRGSGSEGLIYGVISRVIDVGGAPC